MCRKKIFTNIVLFTFITILIITILFPVIKCQTVDAQFDSWAAIPPYNTLWPLWSPVLSPVDAVSGLPTPVITSLVPKTVLPVQPGLTWDPAMRFPWMLYNTPLGLAYYDVYTGVNLWPPPSLMNVITGLPIELSLPVDYATLPGPPFLLTFLQSDVPAANSAYQTYYNSNFFTTAPPVLPATTFYQTAPIASIIPATILFYPAGTAPSIPILAPLPII